MTMRLNEEQIIKDEAENYHLSPATPSADISCRFTSQVFFRHPHRRRKSRAVIGPAFYWVVLGMSGVVSCLPLYPPVSIRIVFLPLVP